MALSSPVNKNNDHNDEDDKRGNSSDPNLSLQRKSGQTLSVILHSAQREVQISHLYLQAHTVSINTHD